MNPSALAEVIPHFRDMRRSRKATVWTNVLIAVVALATIATAGSAVATPVASPTPGASATASVNTALSTGLASNFGLTGPIAVSSAFTAPTAAVGITVHGSSPSMAPRASLPNLKTDILKTSGAKPADPPIPTVSCVPISPSCDVIANAPKTVTTNPVAMNATLNDALFPTIGDVEPPDQMMCAGNGYVVEGINIGSAQVFYASTLMPASGPVTLDSLMGLTGLGYSSGGDVSCVYDANNGGHWFIIEFVSVSSESAGGAFAGCFAAVYDSCLEGIAVSATSNPMGAYNTYFLDPNHVDADPGQGYFLNDYAKLATTRDALMLFYDEYNLNGATVPACPAFGCGGFNGAQELVFGKAAMEMGKPAGKVMAAHENLGLLPTPDGGCGLAATSPYTCWYQVIPAASPAPSQFDNSHGGSGFMVGSLDFFGVGDTRIAVFDWTGLSALNSVGCSKCSQIGFGATLFTGLEAYLDEGAGCPVSMAGSLSYCGLAPQKAGVVPLGTNCVAAGLVPPTGGLTACPENSLASNGDGATQASYGAGEIWMAVSTAVAQKFGASTEYHLGAAYWSFGTASFNAGGLLTLDSQGYVTAAHEDMVFPAVAAATWKAALISFTLSGDISVTGHMGGFFPSTAYGILQVGASGLNGRTIHLAANGQAPEDGFSEYLGLGTGGFRPRWGDYGAAVFVPGLGFVFAAEDIQSPACSPTAFLTDPTCGGTRDPYANFGTAISVVHT